MVDAKKYKDCYQVSNHLPRWVELGSDHTESYLNHLRTWTKTTLSWSDGTGGDAKARLAKKSREGVGR